MENFTYSDAALDNLQAAYDELAKDPQTPRSWYHDDEGDGIVWHFSDIKNMDSILSISEISSKNHATKTGAMSNDNAAAVVNNSQTASWVHDYARFYLRPLTPTQYRNEGIFEAGTSSPRILKDGKPWSDGPSLAHCPIPVFLGFRLKDVLEAGGLICNRSLAGAMDKENKSLESAVDHDLTNFKENITEIYADRPAPSFRKQTEVIVKDSFHFKPDDILRIVVRNNAERVALLTMIARYNNHLTKKEDHAAIDLVKISQLITVDPAFFMNDTCTLESLTTKVPQPDNQATIAVPENPENFEVHREQFTIYQGNYRTTSSALHTERYGVDDLNHNHLILTWINDPYWILSVNQWHPKFKKAENTASDRYYSYILDADYHVVKLFRKKNTDTWFDADSKKVYQLPSAEAAKTLREAEEHVQHQPVKLPNKH